MLNSALASTDSWILSNGTRWCGTGAPLFERVLARAARDDDARGRFTAPARDRIRVTRATDRPRHRVEMTMRDREAS